MFLPPRSGWSLRNRFADLCAESKRSAGSFTCMQAKPSCQKIRKYCNEMRDLTKTYGSCDADIADNCGGIQRPYKKGANAFSRSGKFEAIAQVLRKCAKGMRLQAKQDLEVASWFDGNLVASRVGVVFTSKLQQIPVINAGNSLQKTRAPCNPSRWLLKHSMLLTKKAFSVREVKK